MGSLGTPMGALAVILSVTATALLAHHLVVRPALTAVVRLRLLIGLAILPFLASVATAGSGLQRTTERSFCGSCHVMTTHLSDLEDPKSMGLAARHGRTPAIGPTACYTCHADYGMLGLPMTKLNGLKHVWHYYAGGYSSWSLERFHKEVRTAKPYPNMNCRQCHSGTLSSFYNVKDHLAVMEELDANRVSCASAGCHGLAHPFSKRPEELQP